LSINLRRFFFSKQISLLTGKSLQFPSVQGFTEGSGAV